MRHFVQRYRFACATIFLTPLLAGCGRMTSSGENETMTLLRNGSEKVCVADDVRQTLRDLIVPKAAELADREIPIEKRIAAVTALTIAYEATTRHSFDTSVLKVICDTTVRIGSANTERKSSFRLDYMVSPSAENVATFVVGARTDDARAFATALIGDEINDITAIRADQGIAFTSDHADWIGVRGEEVPLVLHQRGQPLRIADDRLRVLEILAAVPPDLSGSHSRCREPHPLLGSRPG